MSEFMKTRANRTNIRWQLLVTVSAIALLGSAFGASEAQAAGDDSDRPLLWIDLGGQLEQLSGAQESFAPSFVPSFAQDGVLSPLRVQKPPRFGMDVNGTISFQPDESDWIFSASIRYGRSNATRRQHQQTPNAHVPYHFSLFGKYRQGTKYPSSHVKFADASDTQSERHVILDFQAGKDMGLGMFGSRDSSVLSAGVRFAQFSSKADINIRAEPDVQYPSQPITNLTEFIAFRQAAMHFHDYAGMETSQRSFHGVGPSIAWNASASLAGNLDRGELTFDWGANAAVLFGRQKVKGHHQTTIHSYYKQGWGQGKHEFNGFYTVSTAQTSHAAPFSRTRSVVVPNLGGFAGISYRFTNAKLSLGYRADFFFGAIDGGIDTRKSENRGFFGPYASISIGIGD